jgi:hypothetical protein
LRIALPDVSLELQIVLRRLTALWVLGFVLLGTVAPTLACASAFAEADCCPAGSSAPCDGAGSGFPSDALADACCASAPASVASVGAIRSHAEHADHSGAPDPVLIVAWLATFTSLPDVPAISTHSVASMSTDGVLTYLRTGRLRL